MSDFQGLPPALFDFFAALQRNNTREYWQAMKPTWERDVRSPMQALLAELETQFPPLRLFRPHRDLRFATDKSPYKLFTGATSDARAVGGTGYFLQVDADGMTLGCGAMLMDRDELHRFRAAIDDQDRGRQFEALVAALSTQGIPVTAGVLPPLKRVPPAFPKDHPRSEFLRWKGAAVVVEFEREGWMHTADAVDRISDVWTAAEPVRKWLSTHVEEPGS